MSQFLSRPWLWVISPVLVSTAFIWSYFQVGHAKELADAAASLGTSLGQKSQTNESGFERELSASATLHASQTQMLQIPHNRDLNTIGPITDLVIKSVHVREGEKVRRGQVLLELEADAFNNLVKQREEELTAARLELDRVKLATSFNPKARELDLISAEAYCKFRSEDLDTRRKEYESYDKLMRVQAAKEYEYFDAKSKYAQAAYYLTESKRRLELVQEALVLGPIQDKLDVARTTSAFQSAALALDMARRNLANCQVKSCIDGIAGRIDLSPGQVVAPKQSFTQIVQLDPIHVRLEIPASCIEQWVPGRKVDILFEEISPDNFPGKILNLSPQVDPQALTIRVVLEVPNPEYRLRSGINSRARIRLGPPISPAEVN